MKLSIIGDFCYPVFMGGSSKHVYDLMKNFPKMGIDASLLMRSSGGNNIYHSTDPLAKQEFDLWIDEGRIKQIPPFLIWDPIPYIRHIYGSDFVLIQHPVMGFWGSIIAKVMGKKVFYHYHGPLNHEYYMKTGKKDIRYKIFWLLQKITCALSDHIITHSSYMQNISETEHKVPYKKSIRLSPYIETIDSCCSIDNLPTKDKLWILIPRRLTARTGVIEFIENFNKLNSAIRDRYHIFISGKGELQPQVEKYANLDPEHLTYLGFLTYDQLWFIYNKVDIVCVPTIDLEGFGYIILEGMSRGAAPLVSKTCGGGYEFVVKELDSSYTFDVNNTDDLYRVLLSFSKKKFNRNFYREIANKYSLLNMLMEYKNKILK